VNIENIREIFQKGGRKIFQNFHEIFNFFNVNYFIVHLFSSSLQPRDLVFQRTE